jgi:uncharacterized repeat protein (TIGR03837 family)
VDNLGDAGVCWRLARELAGEHGWTVRLWIDDPAPLAKLRPGLDPSLDVQEIDRVRVHRWSTNFPDVTPGDVVIEAFACHLPPSFLEVMAARPRRPVWINLEYLSAEDWVTGCHGLPSPHPSLPLVKHFFFPGFATGTGGLIREAELGHPPFREPGSELVVSLFCYDNPALPRLLDAWAASPQPLLCRVADGLPRGQVEDWLGTAFPVGARTARGRLVLESLPFIPQADYDRLLADCDLNFVRGEDSFVRAQWAERPFVWHIYPQTESAHQEKLEAFMARYVRDLPSQAASAVMDFWRAWNGHGDVAKAWPALLSFLPTLNRHACPWATELSRAGNLAANLVQFCAESL